MLLVPHRRSAPLQPPASRRPSLEYLESRLLPVTNLGPLPIQGAPPSAPPAFDATLVNALQVPDLAPAAPTVQAPNDDVFTHTTGPMGGDLAEFLKRTAPYFDTEGLGTPAEGRRAEELFSVQEPKLEPDAGRDVVFELLNGASWSRDDGDTDEASPVGSPELATTVG